MSVPVPKIDDRSYDDIVAETEALVQAYTGWQPAKADGQLDAGGALIRIFGRMVELAIARLNQVPEKNFLAFLDLIGTQIQPPQPARAPLTFLLAAGSPGDAFVPARTRVAATLAEGESEEILFETDRDLVVTKAQLKAVFVCEPGRDRYGDYTKLVTGEQTGSFPVFEGDRLIEHSLYLSHDEFLALPATKTITFTFTSPDAQQLADLPLEWSYWNDSKKWQSVTPRTVSMSNREWQVAVDNCPIPMPRKINEPEARRWLRVQLTRPIMEIASLPSIDQISVRTHFEQTDLTPKFGFTNSVPLDLGKDFYPFGERPRLNDALYLALQNPAAFVEMVDITVTVTVVLSDPPPGSVNPSNNLIVAWEALTANGWRELEQSTEDDFSSPINFTASNSFDLAINLATHGNIAPQTVNGEEGYWIRARIVRGNYGAEIATGQVTTFTTLTAPASQNTVLTVRSVRGFMPGDLILIGQGSSQQESATIVSVNVQAQTLTLAELLTNNYDTNTSVVLDQDTDQGTTSTRLTAPASQNTVLTVVSVKGFMPGDSIWIGLGSHQQESATVASVDVQAQTLTLVELLTNNHGIDIGVYLRSDDLLGPPSLKSLKLSYSYNTQQDLVPLTACQSYNDFFYKNHTLAAAQNNGSRFQPFTSTQTPEPTLYLGFDQPFANRPTTLYAQVAPPSYGETTVQQRTTARLNWEYYGTQGWTRLDVQDETRTFSERGLLAFMGPNDFNASKQFDQSLHWLRVIWAEGGFQVLPHLHCLRTNTTWASQAITLQQEILGSSNGNPEQFFQTTKAPVLEGQQLEVQERETTVTATTETSRQTPFIWIAWQPKPDFYGSGPQDRHYVLDALNGEVRFGDAINGKIPPQGRNNIRMTYRTGGGQRGDRDAKTLNQLKSAIPYIEGVINHEAAAGGADAETLERVKEEGPKVLRHRERAVTAQDVEDLAYQASFDVARAKAISPRYDPIKHQWIDPHTTEDAGRFGLILVPKSDAPQPIPSLELLNQVENYILLRCTPTLNFWSTGPDWVKVSIEADIAPVSWQAARSLDAKIIETLQRFLHPLTGGLDEQGWAFGREPYESDLYALLESISGVGHVQSLTVKKDPQGEARRDRFLVFSGSHTINLVAPEAKEV